MTKQYDTIIIGAGHNGLVCAAYLAKKGQKVLLLEAADTLGGLASTREFHPGFKASVAHTINQFSSKIVGDLNLAAYGFKSGKPMQSVGLSEDGQHVSIANGKVTGVGQSDIDAFARYTKMMQRYAKAMAGFSLQTIPPIGNNSFSEVLTFAKMGLKIRGLGREDMRELLRIISLPARDLMDENFDNPILKAMLSWDGLIGSKMAPRSPNNTVLMMLFRMIGEHRGAHALPVGGMDGLINALSNALTSSGAEIRTSAPVGQVLVNRSKNGLSAVGVILQNGEEFKAQRIVSAVDPKQTFLDLVGVDNLEIEFTNRINRLRSDGYVAKLHLALDGLPDFNGINIPNERMIIAPEMDAIEFAFDDAKYGEASSEPVMEVMLPSLRDQSLAPEGKHVLSAHIMYVPYNRKGGWTKKAKDQLAKNAIKTLSQYAPGIEKQIAHAELLTPADIAESHLVTGGHWHHGEFALDQMMMMRPTYEAAQYKTPIPGLYLASAGCHPGGGIMGGPGHNAAHEILK